MVRPRISPVGRKRPSVNRLFIAHLQTPLALAATALSVCAAASRLGAEPLTETAGARRVCTAGAESQLARAQELLGAAAVTEAGVLPNPSLYVQQQGRLSGGTEQETIVGLTVPLGIGGRRGLLQDAAEARRDQGRFEAHSTLLEAALSFREAHVSAAADRARVEVLTAEQAALDALSATIERLAAGGEAAPYDLLRQRTQARLHRQSLARADADARASRALVEAWLGSPIEVSPLSLGAVAAPPPPGEGVSEPHPLLRGLRAASRASALEASAARRRWVPDLDLFAGYRTVNTGSEATHGFSASLTVPLTFFDHGQGEAAHAEAERAIADASRERAERLHRAALVSARARLDALGASVADVEATVQEATTLKERTGALYSAGETTISEVLDVFRTVEEAQLGRIETAERIALARLDLMRAAGSQLDTELDKACGAARSER